MSSVKVYCQHVRCGFAVMLKFRRLSSERVNICCIDGTLCLMIDAAL